MTERIAEAIDIFLDAINNGTLAKGTCSACAVGNLIADAGAFPAIVDRNWESRITTYAKYKSNAWACALAGNIYNEHWQIGIDQIKKTKFSADELKEIEKAFEENTCIWYDDYHEFSKQEIRADQIKGLEAVTEVMMTCDDVQEDVKEVFTKKAALIEL